MKNILLVIFVVLLYGCKEKYKIDPKTGGKIISEQRGRKLEGGGTVLWEQTVELPDDYIDTTHYEYNGCGGVVVCGADSVWCNGDTLFYIFQKVQDTIIISQFNPQ